MVVDKIKRLRDVTDAIVTVASFGNVLPLVPDHPIHRARPILSVVVRKDQK